MQRIGEEEIEAIARVIRSKHLSRYSWKKEKVSECEFFEQELAQKFNKEFSLLLSSGTNALISALVGSGVGPGDEVIIPSYTYIATPGAVLASGAIPIIANIDNSLSICPLDIEKRITARTKAIIPVHMNGMPCDMEKIQTIAKKNKLLIIEDVCQSMGGSFRGKLLGTFGDVGCFSFNNYKILTCGEGGAIITNEKKLYERAFINHDMGVNYREYLDAFNEPIFIGQSMRSSEISGAIMRVQLNRLANILRDLRERKSIYESVLNKGKSFKVHISNCTEGECGTSIILNFESAALCTEAKVRVRKLWIFAAQLSSFFRHIVSSWEPILSQRISHHPILNPFKQTNSSKLNIEEYQKSINLLSHSLLLFVPIEASLKETENMAHQILAAIEKNI